MSGPVGADGKRLHGVALEMHNRRETELSAARTARGDIEAVARIVAMLAARVTQLPAPDALRIVGGQHGQEDALAVLRCAGLDPAPQRATWAGERPVQRQASTGPGWGQDPEHAPEALAALASGGTFAYRAKVRELAAARAAEQAGRQAGQSTLWETRSGEQVTEGQAAGQPLRPQTSRPYHDGGAA